MDEDNAWKKPSDVMKRHQRRKSTSQKRITVTERTSVIYRSPSKSAKRKNPFSRRSVGDVDDKRQHLDQKENEVKGNVLFDILDSAERQTIKGNDVQKSSDQPVVNQHSAELSMQPTEQLSSQVQVTDSPSLVEDKPETEVQPHVPVDWCLKSRLRIVSSQPLGWCMQLKSSDEALGVTSFVQDKPSQLDDTTGQKQAFHGCCMYWVHPNLPWCKLFPRITDASLTSKSYPLLLQEEVQRSLQADWEHSFSSAYHQLRSGLCPYFYLCTHQFTVLFHRGTDSQSKVCAMMTPTTRGLREALENEGIVFQLPVGCKGSGGKGRKSQGEERRASQGRETHGKHKEQRHSDAGGVCADQEEEAYKYKGNDESRTDRDDGGNRDNKMGLCSSQEKLVESAGKVHGSSINSVSPQRSDSEESANEKRRDDGIDDDDDEVFEAHDAASGWLESMGLDKKEFPSLDPKKVKLQREGFRVIDHRPESLVYVEGASVQALYNFLLNCRACTAMSGTQAGVPPTILSPTVFKGAVLKSHKVKHTVVKQCVSEGRYSQAHILEVLGPLLPSHCQALTALLHHTQAANFGMAYSNHQPTAPFNILADFLQKQAHNQSQNSSTSLPGSSSGDSRDNQSCKEQTSAGCRLGECETIEGGNHGKFHKNVAIDDRICAIKEIVCTPTGFTWTPT